MTAEKYVDVFDELGIYELDERGGEHSIARPNTGRVMRHRDVDLYPLSLYFNRNRTVGVYFVGKLRDEDHFSECLWERISDDTVKLSDQRIAGSLPIVPRVDRERRAFESLLESLD